MKRFSILFVLFVTLSFLGACDSGSGNESPDPGGTDDATDAPDIAYTPSCDDLLCGDDGCGGTCGACTGGLVCEAGACVEVDDICSSLEALQSYCALRDCGSDGCGGVCGVCQAPATCNIETWLCEEPCTAECSDVECGPDPLCPESSCGTCGSGEMCDDGTCVAATPGDDTGYTLGDVMENVEIFDDAGNPVDAHSFFQQGKVIVFCIGAIWCPYCSDEAAYLADLKAIYGDALLPVYILAEDASGGQIEISEVETWKRVRPWLNYDIYMTKYNGSGNPFYHFFRSSAFPDTLIVSGDDMVVRFVTSGFAADAIAYWIKKYVYNL